MYRMTQALQPGRQLLAVLMILTAISGLVDAVSYLGLGHVFTANMTGNVVILGFAAAGASGFSVPACLTSLGAFFAGAACTGRMVPRLSKRRLLIFALTTEGALTAAAAAIAYATGAIGTGWPRFAVIAALGFGMGVRNATIRRIGIPDMTTTVLTLTLTGLAADAATAGAAAPRIGRRVLAIAAMLIGAVAGALIFLHPGPGLALAIGSGTVLLICVLYGLSAESRQLESA